MLAENKNEGRKNRQYLLPKINKLTIGSLRYTDVSYDVCSTVVSNLLFNFNAFVLFNLFIFLFSKNSDLFIQTKNVCTLIINLKDFPLSADN